MEINKLGEAMVAMVAMEVLASVAAIVQIAIVHAQGIMAEMDKTETLKILYMTLQEEIESLQNRISILESQLNFLRNQLNFLQCKPLLKKQFEKIIRLTEQEKRDLQERLNRLSGILPQTSRSPAQGASGSAGPAGPNGSRGITGKKNVGARARCAGNPGRNP